jgi:hypothetical protein
MRPSKHARGRGLFASLFRAIPGGGNVEYATLSHPAHQAGGNAPTPPRTWAQAKFRRLLLPGAEGAACNCVAGPCSEPKVSTLTTYNRFHKVG